MKNINIIAELACIHEGDKKYIIDLAKECKKNGANSIKFQCFDPEEVVDKNHPDYKYLKSISFNRAEWKSIIDNVKKIGLNIYIDISGEFSICIVEENKKKISGIKLNSSETNNLEIIEKVKKFDCKILLACSGLTIVEIITISELLNKDNIILMYGYQSFPKNFELKGGPPLKPFMPEDLEFWRLDNLKNTFPDFEIGLSDHFKGSDQLAIDLPVYATFMGVTTFEKHVTINRNEEREDFFSSIEPSELGVMSEKIRQAETIIGKNKRKISSLEKKYASEMKRTLYSTKDISKGEKINRKNLSGKRTGKFESTLSLLKYENLITNKNISQNNQINTSDIDLKVGIFCNARMTSSRLKNKGLLKIDNDTTTISFLLKRIKMYEQDLGHLVLATTKQQIDKQLLLEAEKIDIDTFAGPVEDVMGRMVECSEHYNWDIIVRVTGDDLFISCEYIEMAKEYHLKNNNDFTTIKGLPIGMACEIIDARSLKQIHKCVVNKNQTEYLTYFLNSDHTCKNGELIAYENNEYNKLRLTLDYKEDYQLMKILSKNLKDKYGDRYHTTDEVIKELIFINPKWVHKEELTKFKQSQIDTSLVYRQV